MDNLDITPAFIDIFTRINKHLDLLPFKKLLSDQNSTLTDTEKQELKNKINESAKKVRQFNLEKVQIDYEEKNRDLDALQEHLNYVRANQYKTSTAGLKSTQELQSAIGLNDDLNDENFYSDLDEVDQMKKENMNRFINQQHVASNLPKKSIRKPTSSHLKMPNSQLRPTNESSVLKSSMAKKPMFSNDQMTNQHSNQFYQQKSDQYQSSSNNQQSSKHKNDKQPKKEKNVDNIYINYTQINYISLSEFNYIPKYMRGRLSFETCNKLVDEFNKTIETKYKFMMIPSGKYSAEELIKYTLYKNQEDDETRGLFFVTPKDLHEYSELKISMNNTKIFIQCVRHCKRVKEIRDDDSPYCIIEKMTNLIV